MGFGRFFDEFILGQIFQHKAKKKITAKANADFCQLTMNEHPLHTNDDYAQNTIFGKCVVAGTFTASLAVGLSVSDISGKAIANLSYENIIHHLPVFIGDTISAETEILKIRESTSKDDRGIIYVETRAFNQHGEKVLSLRRHVLIPRKK